MNSTVLAAEEALGQANENNLKKSGMSLAHVIFF